MGGLFGGGLDLEAIARMLNPMGTAEAAGGMPPAPIDRINQGFSDAGPGGGAPFQAGPGIAPPPTPQVEVPVAPPVRVPITRSVTPAEVAAAPVFNDTSGLAPQQLGLPGPVGNPEVMAPPASDVGAALAAPLPQGPTPSGQTVDETNTDISSRARDGKGRGGLADALKGVGGIKPPELQRISSPNAPRPTGTIKSGDLQALLMALNAGAPALERKLPMTLGQGVGRG